MLPGLWLHLSRLSLLPPPPHSTTSALLLDKLATAASQEQQPRLSQMLNAIWGQQQAAAAGVPHKQLSCSRSYTTPHPSSSCTALYLLHCFSKFHFLSGCLSQATNNTTCLRFFLFLFLWILFFLFLA